MNTYMTFKYNVVLTLILLFFVKFSFFMDCKINNRVNAPFVSENKSIKDEFEDEENKSSILDNLNKKKENLDNEKQEDNKQ